jgi:hypothetical protein
MRHIVAAAYRKRHPMTGIGGAGGALQIEEAIFGQAWEDMQFSYCFSPEAPPELNGVGKALAAGLMAARAEGLDADLPLARSMEDVPASWLQQDRYVLVAVAWGRELALRWPDAGFFVHEPATAFGLASCGAPYSLVYHHQGPLATGQVESFGRTLHPEAARWWSLIERVAMRCAVETYFPSSGAGAAYLVSAGIAEREAGRIGLPLFNTILTPGGTAGALDRQVMEELRTDRVLFASIGAFSPAKGLDRVPAFLARYRRHTGRGVCWDDGQPGFRSGWRLPDGGGWRGGERGDGTRRD